MFETKRVWSHLLTALAIAGFALFDVARAHAYCTGTFSVPATGYTSYTCVDDKTGWGGTIIAVAGHRDSDGKAFVNVSCENDFCMQEHAQIWAFVDDNNSDGNVCYADSYGPESTVYCPFDIDTYVFRIDPIGPD